MKNGFDRVKIPGLKIMAIFRKAASPSTLPPCFKK
jgi:hypothetical protein